MATGLTDQIVKNAIETAIGDAVEAQTRKIVAQAQVDIAVAIRAEVGKIVLRVLKNYSIERNRDELLIRVQMGGHGE
jgi:hypothetical protein